MSYHCLTPRLRIRRLRLEDWRDLHEMQGDPEATRFLGGVWSEEKTRDVIGKIVSNYEQTELDWLAVADRESDVVVGVCWLNQLQTKWCDALGIGPSI
jgi:RimJ/RimL family protein N-acetyltransferase